MKDKNDDIVKSAIIDAAARTFQKWGYNKTTMEDIAKAAGKGKSTLYYYYKSKEEIFYVFMIQSIAEIFKAAKKKVDNVKTAEDKLKVYVASYLDEIKNYTNLYDIVRGEMPEQPKLIESIRTHFDTAEIDLISTIIKTGIKNSEFKEHDENDIITISYTFVTMLRSLLTELYIKHQFLKDSDKIQMLMEIFFHGIKK